MSPPRSPGWHPDPEAPATLERYHDGEQWTDDSRPTSYVTQPGGPVTDGAPVFGAAPPPVPEPGEARRRMTAATIAVVVAVVLALLALVLVVVL